MITIRVRVMGKGEERRSGRIDALKRRIRGRAPSRIALLGGSTQALSLS
jgi:hypothetical protein